MRVRNWELKREKENRDSRGERIRETKRELRERIDL